MLSQIKLSFRFVPNPYSFLGLLLIAYALVGYPLVGNTLGHVFPRSLPFGVVPCPTTIFTIGLLLLTDKPFPKYLVAIPLCWSLCGFVPVINGILEDIGLIISGLCGAAFVLHKGKRVRSAADPAVANGDTAATNR